MAALALGTATLGGWPFILVWAAAGMAVAFEWLKLTGVEPGPILKPIAMTGTVAAGILAGSGMTGPGIAAACATAALAAALGRTTRDKGWAALGVAYASVLSVVPILVLNLPEVGLTAILWMFAVVWGTDIAGYFTGRMLGGPKLWPRVSPKKTWAGFIGGTLAGTLAGSLVPTAFGIGPITPLLVGASLIASMAGQAGDLAESAMKRHFGVKDSSHLIPGHGGMMDRLDAFWAVAALAGLAMLGRDLLRQGLLLR